MKDSECLWNTKFEHCRYKTARENALQQIVQELNFSELAVEEVKLKSRTIRTRYAAELANVIKSAKNSTDPHDIYVPKLFRRNKHIHSCVPYLLHEPQCQQWLFFSIIFTHSLIK
jgi:glutaredoxin